MPRGIRPEWADLKKKRCLNCPAIFKPTKPIQKFCSAACRKQFDDLGGAYVKLKEYVTKEIKKQVKACNPAEETRIAAIEAAIARIQETLDGFKQAFGK